MNSQAVWLIKIGEIVLKKGNRSYFERSLKTNIETKLGDGARVTVRSGRFYLETEEPENRVIRALETTAGIVAFAPAVRVDKNLDAMEAASVEAARSFLKQGKGQSFKFEVRRSDKSLPMNSYGYARELGGRLLEALPELRVDVHEPDFVIHVELRERAYVYQREYRATGGLPVGSAGRGLLLLSGGIDSPVAGYMMAKRGLKLDAVHFHTPPYTAREAHKKAEELAGILGLWTGGLKLFSVPFTEIQLLINKSVDKAALTLHSRAAMMEIAAVLARRRRAGALVTGESLGQVASQTLESLTYTEAAVEIPVLRPLIGLDKEEIVALARKIGSFEISIRPFDDCCTLFSPEKPLTRPTLHRERENYKNIPDLETLLMKAVDGAEVLDIHGRVY